jgi:hypothetical protein
MARRLMAFPLRDEKGNVLGGSGSELRVYDDAALTTLSTLYANSASGTTVPNPRTPNAGWQTTLSVAIAAPDTTITVVAVGTFAVGDLLAIYDGTNTVYRVITAINPGTRVLTLDSAVGIAFTTGATLLGNIDMKGELQAWLDDVRDYFVQSKNVASTRVLPPMIIPIRVPATTVGVQEEGTTISTRGVINFRGIPVVVTDDAGNVRTNVSFWRHDLWTMGIP